MFTMARIKATRGKGKDFFLNHLSCDDYYSEKEQITGKWHGSLAKELGLEGAEVWSKEFSLFQQNLNPVTGDKLTQRTVVGGIRFYDFQCSAQKSVSVMSMFDERLVEAHREAVLVGMRELEKFAAVRLRSGENVHTQNHENTGQIVYAEFHHDVSRALDPQLHTHNVVCNVTKDKDGVYKALENADMCQAIRYCGRAYQNELARRCIELGYEIENSHDFKGKFKGFEIKGVPENVLEKFSQRTRDIDEQIALKEQKLGRSLTAAEKHEISLDTRSRKMLESDAATVRKEQLGRLDFTELKDLKDLAGKARGCEDCASSRSAAERRPRLTFEEIIPELYENASVLRQDQVLAEALTQNLGQHNLEMWKQALARMEELWNIGGEAHNPYLSPEAVIEAEQYAVEIVEQECDQFEPLGEGFIPFAGQSNRDAQAEVIKGMLESKDRFILLRGVAGSGKTSTLQELCQGMRFGGTQEIQLLAPTNSAVDVLKSEGFEQSQTVASFIMNHDDIPRKSVVIVDEAGLNSLREGVALLKAAKEKDFRLIFVGDSRQHSAVENGDFFRLLEKFSSIDKFSLTEIHRQQVADYKAGIQDCADGCFGAAFERFDRLEYIHEAQAGYISQAAQKYLEFTENGNDFSQTIAVAPTHDECDKLTAEIRRAIPLGETVDLPFVFRSAQWSKAKLGNLKNYEPGQPVMFVRKLKDVANPGDMVTVETIKGKYLHLSNGKQLHISKAGDSLAAGEKRQIELKNGDIIQFKVNLRDRKIYNGNLARITDSPGVVQLLNQNMQPIKDGLRELPEGFGGYDYGWVTTSHKSQGRTANNVIVAAQRLDQKAFYVACSRGRRNLALFCPDKDYLRDNLLRNSSDRLTVHEVRERQYIGKIPALPTKPHIDLNQIQQNRQEYKHKFEQEKSAYDQRLNEYHDAVADKRKTAKECCAKIDELKSQIEDLKGRFKHIRWSEISLIDKISNRLAERKNNKLRAEIKTLENEAEKCRIIAIYAEDDISRMQKPTFNMQSEAPLKFPQRLAAWGDRVIRQAQSKLTKIDHLLVRFAKNSTFETFSDWWRNTRPGEMPHVRQMTWQISRGNTLFGTDLKKLRELPKTEEQYKVFNRAQKAIVSRMDIYRGGALRQIRQQHDERVRSMQQAIEHEAQRLEEHKAVPSAALNQELWSKAFSYCRFSEYDWQYRQTIAAARKTAHEQFRERMEFIFIQEGDLNPMKIPPQLTASEIEQWLLSRTDAGKLNALLETSCNRQHELQLEQERKQQRREEQARAAEAAERAAQEQKWQDAWNEFDAKWQEYRDKSSPKQELTSCEASYLKIQERRRAEHQLPQEAPSWMLNEDELAERLRDNEIERLKQRLGIRPEDAEAPIGSVEQAIYEIQMGQLQEKIQEYDREILSDKLPKWMAERKPTPKLKLKIRNSLYRIHGYTPGAENGNMDPTDRDQMLERKQAAENEYAKYEESLKPKRITTKQCQELDKFVDAGYIESYSRNLTKDQAEAKIADLWVEAREVSRQNQLERERQQHEAQAKKNRSRGMDL